MLSTKGLTAWNSEVRVKSTCFRVVSPDVLRFDNTYSIFQAKRISFSVEVLLPDHMQSPHGASKDHEPAAGDGQS